MGQPLLTEKKGGEGLTDREREFISDCVKAKHVLI